MEKVEIGQAKLAVLKGDITKQETEAIVNAANSSLMGGGGVDGAIHRAGGPAILEECQEIVKRQGRLPPGEAVITTAGELPSKYVIHTVGPIWRGGAQNEPQLLKDSYLNSLKLAKEKGIKTLSFPSISTGAYGYPVELAAPLAIETVAEFLEKERGFEEVTFILFDDQTYENYLQALRSYQK